MLNLKLIEMRLGLDGLMIEQWKVQSEQSDLALHFSQGKSMVTNDRIKFPICSTAVLKIISLTFDNNLY